MFGQSNNGNFNSGLFGTTSASTSSAPSIFGSTATNTIPAQNNSSFGYTPSSSPFGGISNFASPSNSFSAGSSNSAAFPFSATPSSFSPQTSASPFGSSGSSSQGGSGLFGSGFSTGSSGISSSSFGFGTPSTTQLGGFGSLGGNMGSNSSNAAAGNFSSSVSPQTSSSTLSASQGGGFYSGFGAGNTTFSGGFGGEGLSGFGGASNAGTPSYSSGFAGTQSSLFGSSDSAPNPFAGMTTNDLPKLLGSSAFPYRKTQNHNQKVDYVNICAMPEYLFKSQEELRYEDLTNQFSSEKAKEICMQKLTNTGAASSSGFSFGATNSNSGSSIFGSSATSQPQLGGGMFGTSLSGGTNKTHSNDGISLMERAFGIPDSQVSSIISRGGYGSGVSNNSFSSGFGSSEKNAFGNFSSDFGNKATSTPIVPTSTSNLFGVSNTGNNASIFGATPSSADTSSIFGAPSTNSSGFSFFGSNSSSNSASAPSVFGATPSQPVGPSGVNSIFGSDANTQTSSLFGGTSSSTAPTSGQNNLLSYSNPAPSGGWSDWKSGAPAGFGGNGAFGASSSTAPTLGLGTQGGIFGSSNQPATNDIFSTSNNIFGNNSNAPVSLFGPTPNSGSGGIFGVGNSSVGGGADGGIFGSGGGGTNLNGPFQAGTNNGGTNSGSSLFGMPPSGGTNNFLAGVNTNNNPLGGGLNSNFGSGGAAFNSLFSGAGLNNSNPFSSSRDAQFGAGQTFNGLNGSGGLMGGSNIAGAARQETHGSPIGPYRDAFNFVNSYYYQKEIERKRALLKAITDASLAADLSTTSGQKIFEAILNVDFTQFYVYDQNLNYHFLDWDPDAHYRVNKGVDYASFASGMGSAASAAESGFQSMFNQKSSDMLIRPQAGSGVLGWVPNGKDNGLATSGGNLFGSTTSSNSSTASGGSQNLFGSGGSPGAQGNNWFGVGSDPKAIFGGGPLSNSLGSSSSPAINFAGSNSLGTAPPSSIVCCRPATIHRDSKAAEYVLDPYGWGIHYNKTAVATLKPDEPLTTVVGTMGESISAINKFNDKVREKSPEKAEENRVPLSVWMRQTMGIDSKKVEKATPKNANQKLVEKYKWLAKDLLQKERSDVRRLQVEGTTGGAKLIAQHKSVGVEDAFTKNRLRFDDLGEISLPMTAKAADIRASSKAKETADIRARNTENCVENSKNGEKDIGNGGKRENPKKGQRKREEEQYDSTSDIEAITESEYDDFEEAKNSSESSYIEEDDEVDEHDEDEEGNEEDKGEERISDSFESGEIPRDKHIDEMIEKMERIAAKHDKAGRTEKRGVRSTEEKATVNMNPKLTKKGYTAYPIPFEKLKDTPLPEAELKSIENLSISNKHGIITWTQPTDCRNIDFDEIVNIEYNSVEVYRGRRKPDIGRELNKPAKISLFNIKMPRNDALSPEENNELFREYLKHRIEEISDGAKLVSWDPKSQMVSFSVEHFSRYSLDVGGFADFCESARRGEKRNKAVEKTRIALMESKLAEKRFKESKWKRAKADQAELDTLKGPTNNFAIRMKGVFRACISPSGAVLSFKGKNVVLGDCAAIKKETSIELKVKTALIVRNEM